jgi:hypothetical protein
MENMRNMPQKLIRKLEGKQQLGRPLCSWEDIKMDLRETGSEGCLGSYFAQ